VGRGRLGDITPVSHYWCLVKMLVDLGEQTINKSSLTYYVVFAVRSDSRPFQTASAAMQILSPDRVPLLPYYQCGDRDRSSAASNNGPAKSGFPERPPKSTSASSTCILSHSPP
jgi:hypothetical protein